MSRIMRFRLLCALLVAWAVLGSFALRLWGQSSGSEAGRLQSLLQTSRSLVGEIQAGRGDAGSAERLRGAADEALNLAKRSGQLHEQGEALYGLAVAYQAMGRNEKAIDEYTSLLEIIRQSRVQGAISVLRSRGWLYSLENRRELAIEDYKQAYQEATLLGDAHDATDSENLIAGALVELGRFGEARDYAEVARDDARRQHDPQEVAAALSHLADIYEHLGQPQTALKEAEQELQVGKEISSPSIQLAAMGMEAELYAAMGNAVSARSALRSAKAMSGAVSNTRVTAYLLREGCNLTQMPVAEQRASEDEALKDCFGALQLFESMGDQSNVIAVEEQIGFVYMTYGEHGRAREFFLKALPMAAAGGDPELQSALLFYLMSETAGTQPALATWYGKESVNLLQGVRQDNKYLGRDSRTSFVKRNEDHYRELADLLIGQGRFDEAIEVMDALKRREANQYSGGKEQAEHPVGLLSMTPAEAMCTKEYGEMSHGFAADLAEASRLGPMPGRSAAQEVEFKRVSGELTSGGAGMTRLFGQDEERFRHDRSPGANVPVAGGAAELLRKEIGNSSGTVVIYTLVTPVQIRILLITKAGVVLRSVPLPRGQLNDMVDRFQKALNDQGHKADTRVAGHELYNVLVRPVRTDLEREKTGTILWSLDDHLRYVPTAALYDGENYLVERYSSARITPFSMSYLSGRPNLTGVHAVAMGISKEHGTLRALEAVPEEVRAIVRDGKESSTGVLQGSILLDGAFTKDAMDRALSAGPGVVHIASHFRLNQVNDDTSYLLLAGESRETLGGYHLTVNTFREDTMIDLAHAELVTFSVCASGDLTEDSNGREVDGLSATAHGKGAKAVLSTLWEVADNSTGLLMADFYRRWVSGQGTVTKADALRQAQLDMLRGRFGHAGYWAPFVLSGNWR